MYKKLDRKGFSIVEALVAIVVAAAVVACCWLAWRHIHDKEHTAASSKGTSSQQSKSLSPSSTKSTATTTPDLYAGWKTYRSTLGGFTLHYPAGWSIDGYQGDTPVGASITGQETSIEFSAPINAAKPQDGQVGVSVDVVIPNSAYESKKSPYDGVGSTSTLANG